ncbi:MAG: hypothetical protein V4592_00535 [Bacteroidota bacterium]
MKHQILVAAMLAVCTTAFAQGQEKKVKITQTSQLDYVVANDGRTKDGLYYVRNTTNDAVMVQGHYKNNERAGTWYFFDGKANLTMRYSYDQKKMLYIDPASLKNVAVHVLSEDADVAKNASAPLPLCPVDYYITLIGNAIYNNYYESANENLTAEITAHIDDKGKAVYTVAYLVKDKKTPEKQIELNVPFPIEWVPSAYKDKALPSEFTVYAKIQPNTVADNDSRRFRWDNE